MVKVLIKFVGVEVRLIYLKLQLEGLRGPTVIFEAVGVLSVHFWRQTAWLLELFLDQEVSVGLGPVRQVLRLSVNSRRVDI